MPEKAQSEPMEVAPKPVKIAGGLRANCRRLLSQAAPSVSSWLGTRMSDTHVGAHLAWVVLLTGALTFAIVGVVSLVRLRADADEQATALAQLSRQQLARKLDGEARLAEARLRVLFEEAHRQTRYLSQRQDVVKAVVSANSVAMQLLLHPASVTGELDAFLVGDAAGNIIGSSRTTDLLVAGEAIARLGLNDRIASILTSNRRSDRRSDRTTLRVMPNDDRAIGMPVGRSVAHFAFEPVFDDFGDVAGVLIGIRSLAPSESTFEQFSSIVNAGVLVMDGNIALSSGGLPAFDFHATVELADDELISASGGNRVGRCAAHDLGLLVCAHVEASEVQEAQHQMLRVSERQAGALFTWFLVLAAGSLGILVSVVLVAVRRVTRGLPQLATAAASVARGDLDVPFRAIGVGEVRSLGQAFEVMLANLRESLGQTRKLAFFDPVTGLPNRAKLRIDGMEALTSGRSDVVLLFIDLDRFKSINDTFGHKTGDMLLGALARRLVDFFDSRVQSNVIGAFRIGRLGGDEFLAVLDVPAAEPLLKSLVEDLIGRLGESFAIGSAHMTVGASVGIAIAGRDGRSYDDLLISADVAMYEAKRSGRDSYAFFTADAAALMQERLAIEHELRIALSDRTLSVLYQPLFSLRDGRIVGAEALVRWRHPTLGDIPPGKFIGVAEDAGLISDLGHFVLKQAVTETAALVRESGDLRIAVNVSVLQLEDPTFSNRIEACLAQADFPLDRLEIEITESVAMRASDVIQSQIVKLRRAGVHFSLDDFGTGYSNLSMLARLPVDTLKIDRSLIAGIHRSAEQQAIVRTILALSQSLGFHSIVEGVEVSEELDFVTAAGADIAQGFLFSRPVSFDMLKAMQSTRAVRRAIRRLDTTYGRCEEPVTGNISSRSSRTAP
ncbi:EAL domain-containing protein [Bosea vestrisii]|uniref:putative bifunctional diguanylate cyclase/phosphodiesterase n=1 Tax=Bosea vestrisii TaxID=151416 RepID=UPI0024E0239E|nr:EAL domain-containing protein [Bosea vestrisii]WID94874.1 EAL domain-containing protein [Bosea vestrisii]